jgi:hypothetical protein
MRTGFCRKRINPISALTTKLAPVEDNEEAQRLVRRLQEAQDNLLRLFDEVRGYAAPVQLERTCCAIDSIWHEAWGLLNTLSRERHATLVEDSGENDLNVSVDRFCGAGF